EKLNVLFDDWGQKVIEGDSDLFHNVARGRNFQAVQKAAWLIRDRIILANSIDDFLDIHRHDEEVVRYGKAAIAKCILEAERSSKLFFQHSRSSTSIDFKSSANTWLVKLMRLLGRQRPKSDRAKIFEKCTFVVFNYDRAIEHFFVHALQRVYDIDLDEALEIVDQARIFHAYGMTGRYGVGRDTASYGAEKINYCEIGVTSIKTYTETIESEEIRQAIAAAQSIVFLGLAYHDQNLRLLCTDGQLQVKDVLGTAMFRSDSDIAAIQSQISKWAEPNHRKVFLNHIRVANRFAASQMFDDYSKFF
ncbi:MAG: hypothetical protein ABJA75_19270, partial [Bradyrhizobium sp.]